MIDNRAKLLIIEDEPQICRFLRAGLPEEEFDIVVAKSGKEGINFAATYNPELILLDLGLPDLDGIEVVKRIREWSRLPIIVLSARGQEQDKIVALDYGADDYLTKPFALGELHARIKAALRRYTYTSSNTESSIFTCGIIRIDYSSRQVQINGQNIHFTPLEYKLLITLTKNADRVMTHKQLLAEVWGHAYTDQHQYLRVVMGQLRHKIEATPSRPIYLTTEPGVGYRFKTIE
jgi:two-component system, OmpR family, KDP operon response regulator KdpE